MTTENLSCARTGCQRVTLEAQVEAERTIAKNEAAARIAADAQVREQAEKIEQLEARHEKDNGHINRIVAENYDLQQRLTAAVEAKAWPGGIQRAADHAAVRMVARAHLEAALRQQLACLFINRSGEQVGRLSVSRTVRLNGRDLEIVAVLDDALGADLHRLCTGE